MHRNEAVQFISWETPVIEQKQRLFNLLTEINSASSAEPFLDLPDSVEQMQPDALIEGVLRVCEGDIERLSVENRKRLRTISATITTIRLEGVPLSTRKLELLVEYFPSLTHAYFTGIDDAMLEVCSRFHNLIGLVLYQTTITAAGMHYLGSHFETLQKLELYYKKPLVQDGFESLSNLKKLLEFSITAAINDTIIKALTKLTSLTRLQLAFESGSKVSAERMLSLFRALTTLQDLELINYEHHVVDAEDRLFESMQVLVALQKLRIRGFDCSSEDLSVVSTLSQLTSLRLEECENIDDEIFPIIANCHSLTILYFADIPRIGAAIPNLTYPKLTELGFPSCETLSRKSIGTIVKLFPNLKKLDLYANQQVDDDFLEAISHLQELTSLDIYGCPLVTEVGLDELRDTHPQLIIAD